MARPARRMLHRGEEMVTIWGQGRRTRLAGFQSRFPSAKDSLSWRPMKTIALLALSAALPALVAAAPPSKAPSEIVAEAPAADWQDIPESDLLVMETSGGHAVIQLAPDFAPVHEANISRSRRRAGGTGPASTACRTIMWCNGAMPARARHCPMA